MRLLLWDRIWIAIVEWANIGKQNLRWGMNQENGKGAQCMIIGYHKRCWSILTAGRWSWKLKSANECVITHLPNRVALKMDSAETCNRYHSIDPEIQGQCVEGYGCELRSRTLRCYEIAAGADLGGSSKYSSITLEGRSGKGSMWIVIRHGLADLKVQCSSAHESIA